MRAAPELRIDGSLTHALRRFNEDRLAWLDEATARGPIVALRMGSVKLYIVTDPDVARTILLEQHGMWTRPPAAVVPIRVGVGENLFTQRDAAWARVQPAVAPAFRKRAVQQRLDEIDALVADDVEAIPYDTTVDVELAMGCIALRVAAWVLLGEELDRARAEELARHQREVVQWVGTRLGELKAVVPVAYGSTARAMKSHRAVLNAYADEVIARAQSERREDVLGALLAARPRGRPLPRRQLRSHVLGLFLAGNETTAAALAWAVVHGAQSPDAWERLRSDDRYVDAYVDETLRVHPAVWGIPRFAKRTAQLQTGDTSVVVRPLQGATIYLRGMNRDASAWPEPERFDPTRHLAPTTGSRRVLLPFGLGPRGCIGQQLALVEIAAVLPALARRGNVFVDQPVVESPNFALRVEGGLRARFTAPARAATRSSRPT